MNRNCWMIVCAALGAWLVFPSAGTFAQPAADFAWPNVPKFGLGAGMTVCTIRAKSLTDYISIFALPSEKPSTWNIAGEFFAEPEVNISKDLSLRFEYAYLMNSHKITDPLSGGQYDFSYGIHMPSVIVQYMYIGKGFFLKAGVGAGYYLAGLDVKTPYTTSTARSTSHGVGVIVDGSGQTPLTENIFLTIGAGMRFSFAGQFRGGVFDLPGSSGRTVTMNFVSAGASLGAIYYF